MIFEKFKSNHNPIQRAAKGVGELGARVSGLTRGISDAYRDEILASQTARVKRIEDNENALKASSEARSEVLRREVNEYGAVPKPGSQRASDEGIDAYWRVRNDSVKPQT